MLHERLNRTRQGTIVYTELEMTHPILPYVFEEIVVCTTCPCVQVPRIDRWEEFLWLP